MYDIIIIGKGMIGAAAARYLSAQSSNVALVGPDEPRDWRAHRGVFASHYDQGRITRILDASPIWADMAKRSMAVYGEIEQRSGIKFHAAVGGLRACISAEEHNSIKRMGEQFGADFAEISAETFNAQQSAYNFPSDTYLLWEKGLAGYVNPRQLVAAQTEIVKQQGASIISATVTHIEQKDDHMLVTCDSGESLQTQKVLLSAGAYSNMLLPERPLKLQRKAHMVLCAEVGEAEQARLAGMPTVIYRTPIGSATSNLYLLPPVKYPDGRTYIKLGGNTLWPDRIFNDWPEIVDWFHTDGDPKESAALEAVLHMTLPNLKVDAYVSKPCILTYTQHDNPYIDQLDERLFVVTGGNGGAAKSSDAIGHLGARLTMGQAWPDGFDRNDFKAVFE